jgi:Na+/proline symporter
MAEYHLTAMNWWDYVKLILGSEYTLFSAIIGASMANLAAFGTDQDMVQRLLTAETYKKSRRSLITAAIMDLPIGAAFTFIGILLFVYYQMDPRFKPAANPDVFGSYILNVMPPGIRGLVLAGVFATAMGSLSAALNALATSATNDWYIPYFGRGESSAHHVFAARVFTAIFAVLMIATAVVFAHAKIHNPGVRILPVVLGIAGIILGPMLGVFLVGMFTRTRGSDFGNMIALTAGLAAIMWLGGLYVDLLNLGRSMLGIEEQLSTPAWMPKVAFTWFVMIGAMVVFLVAILFETPRDVLEYARRSGDEAAEKADVPLALRS